MTPSLGRRSSRARSIALVLAFGAAGALDACNETPLASRSIVNSPRILDIIANPPETAPSQIVNLRVITGGTTLEPTFRWYLCARPEATTTFTASSTFGQAEPNTGCFPESNDAGREVIPLGAGREVFVGVPGDILQRIEALAAVYGSNLSPESLLRIARTSGIVLTIGVEMRHGDTVVRGIKRLVVANHADPNSNPPPPAFTLAVGGADGGGTQYHMARSLDDPDRCDAFPLRPVRVAPSQRIEVVPLDDESRWLQSYNSYDSSGRITPLTEVAFYSFYTTTGWFSSDRTRPPIRNTIWTAPGAPATATLWLFVRDGRGGSSFCWFDVDVRAP